MREFIIRVWQDLDEEEYTTTFNLLDERDWIVFSNEFEDFKRFQLITKIKSEMTQQEKVKNIFYFLLILFGETDYLDRIMNFSPDYLIEKFDRYIMSNKAECDSGVHAKFKKSIWDDSVFEVYFKRWGLDENNL